MILKKSINSSKKWAYCVEKSTHTAFGRPGRRRCVCVVGWSGSSWGRPSSCGGGGQTKRWPLTSWSCWEQWARRKAAWAAAPPPGETPAVNTHSNVIISSICVCIPVCMCLCVRYIRSPGTTVSACSCCRSHRALHRCRQRQGDGGNPQELMGAWSSTARGTADIKTHHPLPP